jgi:hypothetical protein
MVFEPGGVVALVLPSSFVAGALLTVFLAEGSGHIHTLALAYGVFHQSFL